MIPKLVFAAVAVILTAIVAQPSLAHADPAEDYIAELQRRGIDYSTPTAAINLGKASCQALQEGANLMAVIKTIEVNEGYSSRDTGLIIGAAANTFCPDQLSTVGGFIENPGVDGISEPGSAGQRRTVPAGSGNQAMKTLSRQVKSLFQPT